MNIKMTKKNNEKYLQLLDFYFDILSKYHLKKTKEGIMYPLQKLGI